MPLTSIDRTLLQRCLQHHRGAWNDFVDRYLGLIYHVIHFTAYQRSVPLRPEDVEDVAAEVRALGMECVRIAEPGQEDVW